MKKGWQIKTLTDVCQIKPPKSEARERVALDALVSFAPMEDLGIDRKFLNPTQVKPLSSVVGSYTYFADGDVLLAKITPCFENGKLGIAAGLKNGIGFGSSEFFVFRPCASLDKEYLYYYLSRPDFRSEGAERMGGAVGQQRVPKEFIENYPILLPPLFEQQRIVGILDEAFEGIATAKANAEKNLQNARALFESHLQSVFTQRGEGWVEKRLEEVCVLQRGFDLPTRSRVPGDFPIVSSSGIIDTHNEGPVKGPGVATGRSGSIGNVFYVEADFWPLNTVLYVKQFHGNNPKFVYRLLDHFDLKRFATGAGVPTLNRNFVHDERVIITESKTAQKEIAEKIDALELETQRLESLYQRKLAALDNLKKSLLHQAFTGEL